MISVIITTYNWALALKICLQTFRNQSVADFEIIIADDGSTQDTAFLIEEIKKDFPVPIFHIWHEDNGNRKPLILNKAIAKSRGEYLIFIDGDCLVQNDFIERHKKLAKPNYVVTGSRILISEKLTQKILLTKSFVSDKLTSSGVVWRLSGDINKYLPLLIKFSDNSFRNYQKFIWRRIKGCNLGAWKSDIQEIGGFDESFIMCWGHEDADLVFRLQENGIVRKSGAYATEVLHLWHKTNQQVGINKNEESLREKIIKAGKNYHRH